MIRRISVTQTDIDQAVCPLKTAIKRKLLPEYDVAIGVTGAQIFLNDECAMPAIKLPSSAVRFWHDCDMSHKVKVPFRFLLDIPRMYLVGINSCSVDQDLED